MRRYEEALVGGTHPRVSARGHKGVMVQPNLTLQLLPIPYAVMVLMEWEEESNLSFAVRLRTDTRPKIVGQAGEWSLQGLESHYSALELDLVQDILITFFAHLRSTEPFDTHGAVGVQWFLQCLHYWDSLWP